MESLPRSLNYELPHELQFDKYAQQILENSKTPYSVHEIASTPTITTLDAISSSEFLQKLGVTLFNSIQFQQKSHRSLSSSTALPPSASQMDMEFAPNHLIIDSSDFDAMDELQKQLEYDKFMNEVWIGVVLTLILISMVFCICSCFLYHQFRTWKRNYHSTVAQSQSQDMETAMKLHSDFEDPVPEYTVVSGLPSYEAALELLRKTPQSCLIVHPTVFTLFNKNEKSATLTGQLQQQQSLIEATTPLLSSPTATLQNSTAKSQAAAIPSYNEAVNMTVVSLTSAVNMKEQLHAKKSTNSTSTQVTGSVTTSTASTPTTPNVTHVKTDKC